MNDDMRRKGRLQFLFIALVFLGPLMAAAWLYFSGGDYAPEGRSNHGTLLEPVVNLRDALPDHSTASLLYGDWLLIYAHPGECGATCRDALYTLRQSRLMLGKEMDRVARVFLHGDTPPDTVFIETAHAGLITLAEPDLMGLLENKKPADLPGGGYYLVDPLGNLVMYFEPDIDPYDMVDDIGHLLQLSQIG